MIAGFYQLPLLEADLAMLEKVKDKLSIMYPGKYISDARIQMFIKHYYNEISKILTVDTNSVKNVTIDNPDSTRDLYRAAVLEMPISKYLAFTKMTHREAHSRLNSYNLYRIRSIKRKRKEIAKLWKNSL